MQFKVPVEGIPNKTVLKEFYDYNDVLPRVDGKIQGRVIHQVPI